MNDTSEYGETRIRGILIALIAGTLAWAAVGLLLWSLT